MASAIGRRATAWILAMTAAAGSRAALAQSQLRAERVTVLERFVGDGDITHCNGAGYGELSARLGDWLPEVRMDTDERPGGCIQQFAIVDPDNRPGACEQRFSVEGRPPTA